MDRLTIFRKGLLLIAVPLCFQILFLGLVVTMRRNNIEATKWTIHTNEVIAQAESCGYRILSAHGAVQGFIITHDASFGEELRRLTVDSRRKLRTLVGLVADNSGQTLAARRIEESALTLITFMEEGARMVEGDGMSSTVAAVRRRHAQDLLEEVSTELSRFVAAEQTLNTDRHHQLDLAWERLDYVLFGGLLVSVLSSLLIAVLFSRSISGRIETLSGNSQLLSEGRDLMPPLAGTDEVARLDAVFRRMAETLAVAMKRERADAEVASQRAAEMADINTQLREKAQENEMFVYSVSHDLRSPLVNLQGFGKELGLIGKDLLRAIDCDGVPAEVRHQARSMITVEMGESVGFIQSAVLRLSAIIDSLLRLSRAGRVEYHPQVVAVGPVVDRIIAALRGTIDDRQARVLVHNLPPAFADSTAIEQIFANLIGNAVNYLDPTRPGQVEVSARVADDSTVVYAVADNGFGIPQPYQSKIFTAFQRLHGDVAKGEGIGLALVRRMVERNGGRVWFESEVGRGTTFFVAMPGGIPFPEPLARADAELIVADRPQEVA